MRFEPLDIERAVESQGFAGRDFDVVVAANVLHATADLRAGLGRIRRLLVPGGLLVLIEGTRPQNWIDLTFGLTDGWWKFSDRELRKDHPLLETAGWLRLLEEGGFLATVELAGPAAGGQAADFTVFVASRDATRSEAPAARAAAKVAPMPVPRLDGIAPQKRRKMIQSVVRDSIIGVLGLEMDFQIDPLQGFTDLGFDSLTSLELRNRLQAQMGRPLPATLAFDFPTMAALVNYFCKESMEAPEAERELEDFELAQLSAEETEQLLAEELAKTRGMP